MADTSDSSPQTRTPQDGGNAAAVLAIGVTVLMLLYWQRQRIASRDLPPGPSGWPFVGNLRQLGPVRHISFMALAQQYGSVFRVYFASKLAIVLNDYGSIREAFAQDGCSGRVKGTLVEEFTEGKGLFMSDGELWKEHRRFALSTLRDLGMGKSWLQERILEEVDVIVDILAAQNGQPFDPAHVITNAVSSIICAAMFGRRFAYDDEEFRGLLRVLKEGLKNLGQSNMLMLFPSLKYLPVFRKKYARMKAEQDFVFNYVERMIQETRKTRSLDSPDYVNAFLREAERQKQQHIPTTFESKQLQVSVVNMFVAGTETTSSTLLLGLLRMVENPEVMRRLQAELDEVVGRSGSVGIEHRSHLPFTEATLLEILRLDSVAPIGAIHRTTETIHIGKFTIPKNALVISNLYAAHRDAAVFDAPDVFHPSRFVDENGKFIKSPFVIPFSIGKRACLGESLAQMELFLIFANILHQFDLVIPEGETVSSAGVRVGVTLIPSPYKLMFRKR
ncbi:cytochrome P450 18a1-like [Paramacrobiotus metropolitanus]|uniref:cytochrome P450 18a1-like n=1 Tax=Paramacrobiotus metropolitanus TaxID=2943436 RepID=UPI0024461A54|nr:cytochrome P450 18a1-like [Paramacrobiotus metropolitanus]